MADAPRDNIRQAELVPEINMDNLGQWGYSLLTGLELPLSHWKERD